MKKVFFILSVFISVYAGAQIPTLPIKQVDGLSNSLAGKGFGVWQRKGVVLSATVPEEESNVFEPTVIREGSPQILTDYDTVFKMWYSGGWDDANTYYTESVDGVTWATSIEVIASHCRNSVIKVGSTYYAFVSLMPAQTQIDRYTSSDGVTWTLTHSGVISAGGSGSWNEEGVFNSSVLVDGSTWRLLVDGRSASVGYAQGYYTSVDLGITWTFVTTPATLSGLGQGAPNLHKIGSTYYLWLLESSPSALLPTDLYRYSSPDMLTWTKQATTLIRRTANEGAQTDVGQAADPFLLEVDSSVYLFYSASADGSQESGELQIKLAIASMPLNVLVTTSEGDGGNTEVAAAASSGASTLDATLTEGNTSTNSIILSGNDNTSDSRLRIGSLEVQPYGLNNVNITDNTRFGSGFYHYRYTGYAANIQMYNGGLNFYTAPSGTAGNVSTMTNRFSVSNTGVVRFNDAYSFPTSSGTSGQVLQYPASGSVLEWATVGGGSSQWATVSPNEISYTGASSHSIVKVTSPSGFASVIQSISGDGVDLRLQSGAGGVLNQVSNHPLSIYTNGTERMQFPAASGVRMPEFGAGTATFDGSGNISSASDSRVKHSIKPFTYGLAAITKLKPSTFIYKKDSTNTVMSGFIAQDVQLVIPGAVHKGKDKDGTLSLETNAILAALVNAVKEQQLQIEALKKEIAILKK